MKRYWVMGMVVLTVFLSVLGLNSSGLYADETSDLLLQLLVKKGLVTQQEINELKAELETREKPEIGIVKPAASSPKVPLQSYWDKGLAFESADKQFKVRIGGRLHMDAAWMGEESDIQDTRGDLDKTSGIRRARIAVSGSIYENYIYKLQVDFAGGDADFRDAYLGMTAIPYLGTLRIGQFFEPIGMEATSGSNDYPLMDLSLTSAILPGRNVGVEVNQTFLDDRLTWTGGVFRNGGDTAEAEESAWNVTQRITGLPWYRDGGKKLLHLGVGHSLRNPDEHLRYSARPEAGFAPRFIDTGNVDSDYANLLNYELALLVNSFSLRNEYLQIFAEESNHNSGYMQGFYTTAGYFLTGETIPYQKTRGIFTGITPSKNFSVSRLSDGYWGAWEVVGRYSYLDLKDGGFRGGMMSDVTLGLNWYWNPHMRVMGNYIHSHVNELGDADIFQTRFQVNF